MPPSEPPPLFEGFADRSPPYSAEAEVSVLGGMLIDGDAIDRAVGIVPEARMFYPERHRVLYSAMTRISERGGVIDPVTLAEELRDAGQWEVSGGMQYIATLMDAVPTAANIEYHARIVRERWQARRMIEVGNAIVQSAHDQARPIAERISEAEGAAMGLVDGSLTEGMRPLADHYWGAMERLQHAERGVLSGIDEFDEYTNGFQRNSLYLIAGRPSMGKSALLGGIAVEAAVRQKLTVAFFSTEMGELEVADRALAYEGMVDFSALRDAYRADRFTDRVVDMQTRLGRAAEQLFAAKARLHLNVHAYTAAAMLACARRLKREAGALHLIVVDHVHEMDGPGEGEEKLNRIGKDLKRMAKELDVPVVAGAQLNRSNTGRTDPRPMMSDLRGSGGLEEKADCVVLLHRPEYYSGPTMKTGQGKDASTQNVEGLAEFIIGKQRNGRTGTVHAYFRKECSRFENMAHHRTLDAA